MDGSVERRNVAITLLDDSRTKVLRWFLREAWIAKFEAPELDAAGNEVAIETIELAHEGLELADLAQRKRTRGHAVVKAWPIHPLTRLARVRARLDRVLEAERRHKLRRGALRLVVAAQRS